MRRGQQHSRGANHPNNHNAHAILPAVGKESGTVTIPTLQTERTVQSPAKNYQTSLVTSPAMSLLHTARSPSVHHELLPPYSEVIQGCKALSSSYLQLGKFPSRCPIKTLIDIIDRISDTPTRFPTQSDFSGTSHNRF